MLKELTQNIPSKYTYVLSPVTRQPVLLLSSCLLISSLNNWNLCPCIFHPMVLLLFFLLLTLFLHDFMFQDNYLFYIDWSLELGRRYVRLVVKFKLWILWIIVMCPLARGILFLTSSFWSCKYFFFFLMIIHHFSFLPSLPLLLSPLLMIFLYMST